MTARYKLYIGTMLCLVLCVGGALLAANIMLGDLNQDEGWYLYAARLIRIGAMPYRDFAYSQAPVMPFIYALNEPFVQAHGLLAGRCFTAALAFAAALIAAALSARMAEPGRGAETALLVLILIMVNTYQTYFCAIVKTYSLTSFFLLAGFLALSIALDRPSRFFISISAILLVLAAGTRTSAGIVLPIVLAFLSLCRQTYFHRAWLYFLLSGVLSACVILLPFLVIAPEGFLFWTVSYHALRESGNIWQTLIYKAGFLSRMLGAYFVPIALWVSVLSAGWFARPSAKRKKSSSLRITTIPHSGKKFDALVWICVIAVSLVHMMAPFPYDDYQVFIFPLFAVSVAVMSIRFIRERTAWLLFAVFVLSLGAAVSSPINQDWFIKGRDRIWWRQKEQTPLTKLSEVGALIRSMTDEGDLLLTQDPYLAVESGRMLPLGLEMGQFSYFPELSDEEAEKLNVLNKAGMMRLIEECDAPIAALSGYAFAIRSPHILPVAQDDKELFWSEVQKHYEKLCDIPDFGQAFTTLVILTRIPD